MAILNNYVITPTVSGNNLTLALKTLTGDNPSAGNPVTVRIGSTDRKITAALSVTKNAGTNWCASGGTMLATKEIDYFVYLGYNATDGVVIGFSRIPHAHIYSDFNTTTTNEKYCAISTISNAAAGDEYVNIGRFAATLSGTAAFNWSVPTYTPINLIQRPIDKTRWLAWVPTITYSGGTTDPTSNTLAYANYLLSGNKMHFELSTSAVAGSGNRTFTIFSIPMSRKDTNWNQFASYSTVNATTAYGTAYTDSATLVKIAVTIGQDGVETMNGVVGI